jgi:hypothetical protein
MHETFLAYRQFLYLKIAAGIVALSALAYALHDPQVPPNGGTWLGYALGTVGALMIFWLAWLGVRKRQYHSTLGTLKGWLSAHVYFGLALVFVATLHCGFQFGWNVHTLAYVLMVMVVLSGLFGLYTYWRCPALLTKNRGDQTDEAMLSQIDDLDERALKLASQIGDNAHQIVLRSIGRAFGEKVKGDKALGGMARGGPTAKDVGEAVEGLKTMFGASKDVTVVTKYQDTSGSRSDTIFAAAGWALKYQNERSQQASQLLDLLTAKKSLVAKLQRDMRFHILLKDWLSIHVPLTIMLIATLIVHIVSVFLYW